MECKDFQKLINDFIFDKIEYSEDLKEFLNHAKTCKNCGEELELYYTIRRGLGDVKAPDGSEESVDATQELENIINFYDEYFEKQRKRKKSSHYFCYNSNVNDYICNCMFIFKYHWYYIKCITLERTIF